MCCLTRFILIRFIGRNVIIEQSFGGPKITKGELAIGYDCNGLFQTRLTRVT